MRCKAPRIRTPAPYFGNKRHVAGEVWRRLGDVRTYVEPFFGAGAVLLYRPDDHRGGREIVNDADGLLANVWRALKADPEAVVRHACDPVIEVDMAARQSVLVARRAELAAQLRADPDFYDARLAGWWLHGQSATIGSTWCDGHTGPRLPSLGSNSGVHAQCGPDRLRWVGQRVRKVKVACGDWARLQGRSTLGLVKGGAGHTGVFLDPPYGEGVSYFAEDGDIAGDVWRWACEVGDDPRLRLAVCGYEDGRDVPDGWTVYRWDANKRHGGAGFANRSAKGAGRARARRETIWFSPHCLAA